MRKSTIIKTFLVTLCLAVLLPDLAWAHANAKQNNSCFLGRRYFAKAKVNGPGCNREVDRGWDCNFRDTGDLQVFIANACDCVLSGGTRNGAQARAVSGPNILSESTFKDPSCSGYRAGGEVPAFWGWETPSAKQGEVSNQFRMEGIDYDYKRQVVILNSLSGSLIVKAEDLMDEFSTVDLSISQVFETRRGEVADALFSVRFSIERGEFHIEGGEGVFSAADFLVTESVEGLEVTYRGGTKEVYLPGIHERMFLQTSLTGDVGNVKIEPVAAEKASFTIYPTQVVDGNLNILVKAADHLVMEFAIYDLMGVQVAEAQQVETQAGAPAMLTFDYDALPSRRYLLVVMKDADGNTEVKKIFKP